MMNLKSFMKKVGVTKKEYVLKWLEENLIPGVVWDDELETAMFPDSARRPYRSRWLRADSNADAIRAHIVKACIDRQHILHTSCYMSRDEFRKMITELEKAGLLSIRIEDGVEYYDSTIQSGQFLNKSLREVRRFVAEMVSAVSEGAAKGGVSAALEHVS